MNIGFILFYSLIYNIYNFLPDLRHLKGVIGCHGDLDEYSDHK
jgi:hypothetical protein